MCAHALHAYACMRVRAMNKFLKIYNNIFPLIGGYYYILFFKQEKRKETSKKNTTKYNLLIHLFC